MFHHNKTHVIIWILHLNPPTHMKNEILAYTYKRIQTGSNLLLQHLQPLILFRVVDGHLVVHKSWHELCLRVKSEFNGNRVEPQNNPNLQLLDVWLVISMVLDFRVHESFEWSLVLIAIEAFPRSTLLSIHIPRGSTMSIPCTLRNCVSMSHFLRYHLGERQQYSTTIDAQALFPCASLPTLYNESRLGAYVVFVCVRYAKPFVT